MRALHLSPLWPSCSLPLPFSKPTRAEGRNSSAARCLCAATVSTDNGRIGSDLGRQTDRDYTPALLASRVWNHAPSMRKAARAEQLQLPPLNENQAADLFAYFYSVRFFERPGDAGRGKRIFNQKHCAQCQLWTGHAGQCLGVPERSHHAAYAHLEP